MHDHHRQHYWKVEPLAESVETPALLPESGYGVLERRKVKGGFLVLATSAQKKCSALVCSCYAPLRQHNNNSLDSSFNSNYGHHKQPDSGFDQEPCDKNIYRKNMNGKECDASLAPPLRSNLKKASTVEDQQLKRKVSWPDAHGKDLAHVQEFDSSEFENREFGGVRNSCVCVIQ